MCIQGCQRHCFANSSMLVVVVVLSFAKHPLVVTLLHYRNQKVNESCISSTLASNSVEKGNSGCRV